MQEISLDDKVGKTQFKIDSGHPHMKIDPSLCVSCSDKPCLYVCPVRNFRLDEAGKIVMSWEGCIECGGAIVACQRLGRRGLTWEYPRGGFGVRHIRG